MSSGNSVQPSTRAVAAPAAEAAAALLAPFYVPELADAGPSGGVQALPVEEQDLARSGLQVRDALSLTDWLHSSPQGRAQQRALSELRAQAARWLAEGLEPLARDMEMRMQVAFDGALFVDLLRDARLVPYAHSYLYAFRSWARRRGAAQHAAFQAVYLWVLLLHWAARLPRVSALDVAAAERGGAGSSFWEQHVQHALRACRTAPMPPLGAEADSVRLLAATAARIHRMCTRATSAGGCAPRFQQLTSSEYAEAMGEIRRLLPRVELPPRLPAHSVKSAQATSAEAGAGLAGASAPLVAGTGARARDQRSLALSTQPDAPRAVCSVADRASSDAHDAAALLALTGAAVRRRAEKPTMPPLAAGEFDRRPAEKTAALSQQPSVGPAAQQPSAGPAAQQPAASVAAALLCGAAVPMELSRNVPQIGELARHASGAEQAAARAAAPRSAPWQTEVASRKDASDGGPSGSSAAAQSTHQSAQPHQRATRLQPPSRAAGASDAPSAQARAVRRDAVSQSALTRQVALVAVGGRSVCEPAQSTCQSELADQSDGEQSDDGASSSCASSSSDEDDEYTPSPRGARHVALHGEHAPERSASRALRRASDRSQAVRLAAASARAAIVSGVLSGAEGQRGATRAEAGAGVVEHAAAVARAQEQLALLKRTSCQRLGMTKEERASAIEAASANLVHARKEQTPARSADQTGGTSLACDRLTAAMTLTEGATAAAATAAPLSSIIPAAQPVAAVLLCRSATCAPLPAALVALSHVSQFKAPQAGRKRKAPAEPAVAPSAAPVAQSVSTAEGLPAKKARGGAGSPAAGACGQVAASKAAVAAPFDRAAHRAITSPERVAVAPASGAHAPAQAAQVPAAPGMSATASPEQLLLVSNEQRRREPPAAMAGASAAAATDLRASSQVMSQQPRAHEQYKQAESASAAAAHTPDTAAAVAPAAAAVGLAAAPVPHHEAAMSHTLHVPPLAHRLAVAAAVTAVAAAPSPRFCCGGCSTRVSKLDKYCARCGRQL